MTPDQDADSGSQPGAILPRGHAALCGDVWVVTAGVREVLPSSE